MRHTFIFVAMLLTASAASAGNDDRVGYHGYHEHDGFYLRLQVGGGYTRASLMNQDLATKGGAVSLNAEFGAAPLRNLILALKVFTATTTNPDLELNDVTLEGRNVDRSQTYAAVGGGLTYYFMPANVYLSGGVTVNQLSDYDDGKEIRETGLGTGLHLGLGKEWWVSSNWGLGFGLEFAAGRVPEKDKSPRWQVVNGSLFLSATFN